MKHDKDVWFMSEGGHQRMEIVLCLSPSTYVHTL